MSFFTQLLGLGPKTDFKELYARGAQIVDVRSSGEFSSGNIKQSVNIPLGDLAARLKELKKDKPVIAVCASGMRSEAGRKMLADKGYDAYNGGSWSSLKGKLGL